MRAFLPAFCYVKLLSFDIFRSLIPWNFIDIQIFHFHSSKASNRFYSDEVLKMIHSSRRFAEMNSFAISLNVSTFCWKCQAMYCEIYSLFQLLEAKRQRSLKKHNEKGKWKKRKKQLPLNGYYIIWRSWEIVRSFSFSFAHSPTITNIYHQQTVNRKPDDFQKHATNVSIQSVVLRKK